MSCLYHSIRALRILFVVIISLRCFVLVHAHGLTSFAGCMFQTIRMKQKFATNQEHTLATCGSQRSCFSALHMEWWKFPSSMITVDRGFNHIIELTCPKPDGTLITCRTLYLKRCDPKSLNVCMMFCVTFWCLHVFLTLETPHETS